MVPEAAVLEPTPCLVCIKLKWDASVEQEMFDQRLFAALESENQFFRSGKLELKDGSLLARNIETNYVVHFCCPSCSQFLPVQLASRHCSSTNY